MKSDPNKTDTGPSKLEFEAIGPYKVLGLLGQGGMGTVYHAMHVKSGEQVAVKVIASAMAQHQRFRRRFDAEIQTLVKLKHPGIVQLIGFGEEKGLLFYSMEYVEGENLQQLLRREKSLPWERVIDMAIEVCSALKHAHDFGIIHRDLKPANLMITTKGSVKLTDFGIAKLFGASEATVEGSVLGTADFMSPEQAEGKPVSVRSDLYALGSVCYASLTGRAPYQGKSIPEVLFNVRYGTFPKIQELVPKAPAELCKLIEELLEREPSKRPPTGLVVGNRFQSLRVGLKQRTQSASDASKEGVDAGKLKELTSIDLDESSSLLGGIKGLVDQTVIRDPYQPDAKQVESPEFSSDNLPKGTREASHVVGPHDKTIVQPSMPQSPSHAGIPERPSGIDFIGKTSFTEVNDDDRRRSATTFQAPVEEKSPWGHWVAIGTLAAALIGCIGLLIYMLQAPSADTLYKPVAIAIQQDEEELWLDAEDFAIRFRELYPNDERIGDIEGAIQEAESIRSIRQLQRKARRGITDQLSAIEQAYLECVKAQGLGSQEAGAKLEAFLVLFGADTSLSPREQTLVTHAKKSLDELRASQKVTANEAYTALKEKMDWADTHLTAVAKAKWLQSMTELFGDKAWAKELLRRAKDELTRTETNPSDQPSNEP
ncbi:Serine/threonine-protein kinase PrkC [Pirellula sp. SH-Sr6A]|uniref:serine/threonine-protein kinase n=1 Tax=Pirellula sp. SH-Sr6A TaxID=1632865 RepID=UPI00078E6EC4|nr:serine/threonine-protein kinase [Pirellula sp. SH-Sr6A]AMV32821.1 Serine/threonine-protein kinase PrkC [Pirellula sp. SH-Sr6A]